MSTADSLYLPGQHQRARWMRLDAARILKRLFFCERSLIVSQGAWLSGIASFDVKIALPRLMWEDAMTAHALRERIFELHYPSRLLEIGEDAPLVDIFDEALHAPCAEAFVLSLAQLFKPALLEIYRAYLQEADELTDGPILRALRMAVEEKQQQIAVLERYASEMLAAAPDRLQEAEAWVASLERWMRSVGGLSFEPVVAAPRPEAFAGRQKFEIAEVPARDARFHRCRFYWPDVIDAAYPYGEGIQLQLRSAVSHLNEVWAVETAGIIIYAFADELPWEFLYDAARWAYDEARHTRMGYERLRSWDFQNSELPLGTYIFDSARGQDPIVRIGMLHYFETKNIGKKTRRAEAFAQYQDRVSQHDMDFDWADETIHAWYGKRWIDYLRETQPERVPDTSTIHALCDSLVAQVIASATNEEKADIRQVADAMVERAHRTIAA